MGRKGIREVDAKRLLQQHLPRYAPKQGDPVRAQFHLALVAPDTDRHRLLEQHPWLQQKKLVVKPDQLFGQRGKHGLVLVNADWAQAQHFIDQNQGREIELKKGARGTLTHFLIEEFIPHKEEFYLSFNSERESTLILFSPQGGVDVEQNWETMRKVEVPVGDSPTDADLQTLLKDDITDEKLKTKIGVFIRSVFQFFEDLDFTTFEMNPFTFDSNGNLAILDAVAEVDGTAHFKNTKKWGEDLQFPQPFGRSPSAEESFIESMDEKTGASLKLTILNPKGRIWTLVAGGGASVIYADTVADVGYGNELGNYGEYSGAPNEEETYHYAKTVIDLATRDPDGRPRALLIGGGIANFTDVAKTFKGIIHALKEYKQKLQDAKVKVFVRRAGPNYQTGLKLMRQLSAEIGVSIEVFGPESSMTSIVPLAIQYLQA